MSQAPLPSMCLAAHVTLKRRARCWNDPVETSPSGTSWLAPLLCSAATGSWWEECPDVATVPPMHSLTYLSGTGVHASVESEVSL